MKKRNILSLVLILALVIGLQAPALAVTNPSTSAILPTTTSTAATSTYANNISYPQNIMIFEGKALREPTSDPEVLGRQIDYDPSTPKIDNVPKGTIMQLLGAATLDGRIPVKVRLADGTYREGTILNQYTRHFAEYKVTNEVRQSEPDGSLTQYIPAGEKVTSRFYLEEAGDQIMVFRGGEKGLVPKSSLKLLWSAEGPTVGNDPDKKEPEPSNPDPITTQTPQTLYTELGVPLVQGEYYAVVTSKDPANLRDSNENVIITKETPNGSIAPGQLVRLTEGWDPNLKRTPVEFRGVNGGTIVTWALTVKFIYRYWDGGLKPVTVCLDNGRQVYWLNEDTLVVDTTN